MIDLFRKKVNKENYIQYLEKEVETLRRKIKQFELERDNAINEKKRAEDILNKYKTEYESLIADSKKLIEKQKKADKTIDKIISNCRNELGRFPDKL